LLVASSGGSLYHKQHVLFSQRVFVNIVSKRDEIVNVAVWVVQVLLALAFVATGLAKITQPREKLQTNMKWVEDFAPNTIKGIGTLEVLAAVGLILPFLTGILPVLTPLAAVGLILVMLGAIYTHVRRGEAPIAVANLVLLVLAAFVAYGRFVAVPYGTV
jgi:uncharacterized membrane protein YphA (DoxX/SURF4 family)